MSKVALDPTQPLFGVRRGSFPGVKWLGHEGNHSLLSSVEVKSEWTYTFAPPVLILGVILPVTGLILICGGNTLYVYSHGHSNDDILGIHEKPLKFSVSTANGWSNQTNIQPPATYFWRIVW